MEEYESKLSKIMTDVRPYVDTAIFHLSNPKMPQANHVVREINAVAKRLARKHDFLLMNSFVPLQARFNKESETLSGDCAYISPTLEVLQALTCSLVQFITPQASSTTASGLHGCTQTPNSFSTPSVLLPQPHNALQSCIRILTFVDVLADQAREQINFIYV